MPGTGGGRTRRLRVPAAPCAMYRAPNPCHINCTGRARDCSEQCGSDCDAAGVPATRLLVGHGAQCHAGLFPALSDLLPRDDPHAGPARSPDLFRYLRGGVVHRLAGEGMQNVEGAGPAVTASLLRNLSAIEAFPRRPHANCNPGPHTAGAWVPPLPRRILASIGKRSAVTTTKPRISARWTAVRDGRPIDLGAVEREHSVPATF